MKNIEYIEKFFKKHKLSGKISVEYQGKEDDDYMSSITFENGVKLNINDIIFDIESDLDNNVVKSWMKSGKTQEIDLINWLKTSNHIISEIDTSSIEDYHKEMESIIEDVKETMNKIFKLETDESGDE